MHLERDDGQPTRRPTRSVGTNTDDSAQPVHLPTDVTTNLEQSKLRHALIIAINRFANDINVGTFNKLLELLVSLLCYDDILTLTNQLWQVLFKAVGINTNPTDFIVLSLNTMSLLEQANKSNIVYKLVRCLATKRPGSEDPLLPLDRMPFGLIQYQIDFFNSTHISQVCQKHKIVNSSLQVYLFYSFYYHLTK